MKKGMTIREAAQEWVGEMDFIQQGMIQKLMEYEPDDWSEVTSPAPYDRVFVYATPDGSNSDEGEIVSYDDKEDTYRIRMDDGVEVELEEEDFSVIRYDSLPMWGTMFSFRDPCDNHWIEEEDGVGVLSRCGFRVYRSEEFGYFFGIDAAGLDFYEAYWCPLYLARGLQWHDPCTVKSEEK